MKKFLAVLLAVAMVATALFAVFTPAGAADEQAYLKVNGIEGSNSRTENQLNIVAPIAADDVVAIDFRPVGDATYDGGIFDVRTHNAGRKLFFAKPSSSEPGTWSVTEQTDSDPNKGNKGIVDMETVSIVALEDGWYRASFEVTVDLADGLHMSFGYIAVEIDNLTIGTKVCSFNEANVVEFAEENEASLKFDDGTEFTIEKSANGFDWVASLVVDAEAADKINCYDMEVRDSGDRARVKLNAPLAVGDKLSFYIKPVESNEDGAQTVDKMSLYARVGSESGSAVYLDADLNRVLDEDEPVKTYSGNYIVEYGIECEDGWYLINCEIITASTSGFELSIDASNKAIGAECQIAGVKINGVEVAANEVVAYSAGTSEPTPIDVPEVVEDEQPSEQPSEEPTDDETEDVEPTGAISAAVVAIAAVIGGAVVLKKREI